MKRKILVVGDSPISGGEVLGYDGRSFRVLGHRVALIGGRAYCNGCKSVGIIAKAGGPRRLRFISEVALDGDVVVCRCPAPQPIVSRLQGSSTYEDGAWLERGVQPIMATTRTLATLDSETAAFKKAVDEAVTHPATSEISESFCPNMNNNEFCSLMLRLRDRAVFLIAERRLPELERWDKAAQDRVKEWFGLANEPMRQYLQQGFRACERVLNNLTCANFIRYSDISQKKLVCTFPSEIDSGTVAAVCKPDTVTHTIAFTAEFCDLREFSAESDSKLLTLIHEVTHFNDCFASMDTVYKMKESRKAAASNAAGMKTNADSLAGYVVWGESYVD